MRNLNQIVRQSDMQKVVPNSLNIVGKYFKLYTDKTSLRIKTRGVVGGELIELIDDNIHSNYLEFEIVEEGYYPTKLWNGVLIKTGTWQEVEELKLFFENMNKLESLNELRKNNPIKFSVLMLKIEHLSNDKRKKMLTDIDNIGFDEVEKRNY